MEFPLIYDIIHNNEPKVLFWFGVILIILFYFVDNIFLIIIFYTIIIYYIHSYIHTNQFKESYALDNKYNNVELKYEEFKKYKELINLLYELKEYKDVNISKFRDLENLLYKFIRKYEAVKEKNSLAQVYYEDLVDLQYHIIKTLDTFKLDVYNKESNDKILELNHQLYDIIEKKLQEVYDIYHLYLVKNKIDNKTKLIDNAKSINYLKPSNFLDHHNMFENTSFNKLKLSSIL